MAVSSDPPDTSTSHQPSRVRPGGSQFQAPCRLCSSILAHPTQRGAHAAACTSASWQGGGAPTTRRPRRPAPFHTMQSSSGARGRTSCWVLRMHRIRAHVVPTEDRSCVCSRPYLCSRATCPPWFRRDRKLSSLEKGVLLAPALFSLHLAAQSVCVPGQSSPANRLAVGLGQHLACACIPSRWCWDDYLTRRHGEGFFSRWRVDISLTSA